MLEAAVIVVGMFAGLALIGALFALFGDKIDDYIDYEYGDNKKEEEEDAAE